MKGGPNSRPVMTPAIGGRPRDRLGAVQIISPPIGMGGWDTGGTK